MQIQISNLLTPAAFLSCLLLFQRQFSLKHIRCSTATARLNGRRCRHQLSFDNLQQLILPPVTLLRLSTFCLVPTFQHPTPLWWTAEYSRAMVALAANHRYRSSTVSYSLMTISVMIVMSHNRNDGTDIRCLLYHQYESSSTKFGHRAFSVAGLTAWNSLLDYLPDPSLSQDTFRRSLMTYLFVLC